MPELFGNQERKIQEALNQAKRLELQQKYGARFPEGSALPPEVEEQWLNNIEEFERQYEHSREITVREFLGNPTFPALEDLPPGNLEEELASALDFLAHNDIAVDCLAEVSNEDLYRFVTVELMQADINDVRIPGMTHHFIYEEFHPNDELDAKSSAEHFLAGLFARDEQRIMETFPREDGDPSTAAVRRCLKSDIQLFYSRFAAFPHHEFDCTDCRLDGDYATVNLQIRWVGLLSGSLQEVSYDGNCEIRLTKSPYGLYDALQARFRGFSQERQ